MSEERILLVTPYFPPDIGGVEQYVRNLGRELRHQSEAHVIVVASGRASQTATGPESYEDEGLTVYRLPPAFRVSNTPVGFAWFQWLRAIVQTERVSLVNAHAPVPWLADLAARACGDLPFVLTYHIGTMKKGRLLPDMAITGYERLVLPRTAARADQIICSSDYVRSFFFSSFGDRATTISPGVDVCTFVPGGHPEPCRILFVASLKRLVSYKGLPDLLAALWRLRSQGLDVTLDVVGDGDGLSHHAARSRAMGLGNAVTFHGRLSGAPLVEAYQRATVVALPTRGYDSFPTVLVEAMACGRPVVSTAVGGIPGLVDEGINGLLVAPHDVSSLTDRLDRVLRDNALATRLGIAGRQKVLDTLSWRRQAERTAEVFAAAREVRAGRSRRSMRERGHNLRALHGTARGRRRSERCEHPEGKGADAWD
jgi:glycosyltransferase involved in cell wall biosynthesis